MHPSRTFKDKNVNISGTGWFLSKTGQNVVKRYNFYSNTYEFFILMKSKQIGIILYRLYVPRGL